MNEGCYEKQINLPHILESSGVKERHLRRERYDMTDKVFDNNQVSIAGEVVSEFTFSHDVFGEGFYVIDVVVSRLSNSYDIIPIMVSERLIDVKQDYRGRFIEIFGQFRSYNRHEESKNKLVLSVFARDVKIVDELSENAKPNFIFLDGYVCKPPIYRKTPLGREIADILLAVNTDPLVHLTDRGRRSRDVVELDELGAGPAGAELAGEDLVHPVGAHRRPGLLELGERGPVRPGQLLGHRGLHDRQGLTELHRAALELPENGEQLFGRAGLQLGGDGLGRSPTHPLAHAHGDPAGVPQGQADELGGAGDGAPRDVGHPAILTRAHPQSARTFHRRWVKVTSARPISVEIPPRDTSPRRVDRTMTVATAQARTTVPDGVSDAGWSGRMPSAPGAPAAARVRGDAPPRASAQASPQQRRHAVLPGRTSGPTTTRPAPTTTGR